MDVINVVIEDTATNTVTNTKGYIVPDNVDIGKWLVEMSKKVHND